LPQDERWSIARAYKFRRRRHGCIDNYAASRLIWNRLLHELQAFGKLMKNGMVDALFHYFFAVIASAKAIIGKACLCS
jgi:hypothetical protein